MNFALVYPGEKSRFAILATLAIIFWVVVIIGTLGLALLYILLIFIFYVFAHSGFISYLRGSAVRVSPEQFPDLHARVVACCKKVGVETVPDTYLLHADGIFNALATRFLGRHYVVLFTSVLDALDQHPDAINFYIGHELGHVHRKHLKWGPVLAPMAWLPLIGSALRRAQEYTCDRYGLASCDSTTYAKAGIAALVAGSSRWARMNYAAYAGQRESVAGFWASFHEFTGDYPWTSKRAFAIDELAAGREPKQPRRNFFAGVLAFFVPRVPGAGGAGILIVIAIIGVLAAVAIPAYQKYMAGAGLGGLGGFPGLESGQESGFESDAEANSGDQQSSTQQPLQDLAPYLEAGRNGVLLAALSSGNWPTSVEELGLGETRFTVGDIDVEVGLLEEGMLDYQLRGGGYRGESLYLNAEPVFENEQLVSINWTCLSNIPFSLLPQECQEASSDP